ncbi:953_t:CDS:2, partial [Cetraspora pellucida]
RFYYSYGNQMITNVTPSINSSVDSSTTNISIRFFLPVVLSTGNITIYKDSDHTIRQRVSANSGFCELSEDGHTVNISIISSTFNEYNETYYVKMDNHFARNKRYNEPLREIKSRVWQLKSGLNTQVMYTHYIYAHLKKKLNDFHKFLVDEDVTGIIQLIPDASEKFFNFNKSERLNYFDTLKQELIDKVPVKNSKLTLGPKFGTVNKSIIVQLRIDRNVASDLGQMIKDKHITSFSSNTTNDLDPNFGFQNMPGGLWDSYGTQIVAVILTYIILCLLSRILSYKLKSKQFEAISSTILRLGLIIPNFILSILFVAHNSNDVPELYLP